MNYEKDLETKIEQLQDKLETSDEEFDLIKGAFVQFVSALESGVSSVNVEKDLGLIEECIRGCDDGEVFEAYHRISNIVFELLSAISEMQSELGLVDDTLNDDHSGWAAVEDEDE
jgi:hypothetical protein